MKKTQNKWKTNKCGRCGDAHIGYSGKLDANGIEYVVCGNTHKRMNVSEIGKENNTFIFFTEWIKI
jgi:intracellular sulfur oxidation DsrE/DsrF family protein